ncbi:MAG: hypothetical protein IJG31_00560 [Fusobacterium sp.]|nr:hypothetical protein [Fusobacterium sp.]
MKKVFFTLFLLISSFSFSVETKLPENVEKIIRSSVSNFSGSERKEYYSWYSESYFELIKRLENSGIPKQDTVAIEKRLSAMYGGNYPKQLAAVNNEIADYQNLVQRIKDEQKAVQEKIETENQKSKEEIREILKNSNIPTKDLENIELNAQKEFPKNYTLQKAYIKGAVQTYLELKNMIKK